MVHIVKGLRIAGAAQVEENPGFLRNINPSWQAETPKSLQEFLQARRQIAYLLNPANDHDLQAKIQQIDPPTRRKIGHMNRMSGMVFECEMSNKVPSISEIYQNLKEVFHSAGDEPGEKIGTGLALFIKILAVSMACFFAPNCWLNLHFMLLKSKISRRFSR